MIDLRDSGVKMTDGQQETLQEAIDLLDSAICGNVEIIYYEDNDCDDMEQEEILIDKATVNKLTLLEREVESVIEDDLRFKILDGKEYEFRIYNGDFGISIKKTQDSDKEEKEVYDKIKSIIGKYVHEKAVRLQNQFANIKIIDINDLK